MTNKITNTKIPGTNLGNKDHEISNVPGFGNIKYISKKEEIKRDVWEVIIKLFENGFDQTEIIEALAEMVKEEKQDHKEVYSCNCCDGVQV